MKIDILTLFPEMFTEFINSSIIKRAIDRELVTINIHNIRDYSLDKNKKVDDYPFGGGPGMVLMCEPIFRAIEDIKRDNSYVIMLTPSGQKFNQKMAQNLVKNEHIIILCGHYEGFDERIKTIVNLQLSIGDYVLTGGELASMVITDSLVRLIPNVISTDSLMNETFNDGLVDYPNYTKPVDFRGLKIPEVLLSGHHEKIQKYRQEQRELLTKEVNEGE